MLERALPLIRTSVVRRSKIDDDFDREGITIALERWDQETAVGDRDERQAVLNLAVPSSPCDPKAVEETEIRMVVPRVFTGCLWRAWPMRLFVVVRSKLPRRIKLTRRWTNLGIGSVLFCRLSV